MERRLPLALFPTFPALVPSYQSTSRTVFPQKAMLWMTPDGKVTRPCKIVMRTLTGVGVQFEQ
jgi:hypothetical protein